MSAKDPYVKFYVGKKRILFPLITKYSGKNPWSMTHGGAADVYISLLRSSPAFRSEVDSGIAASGYKNAIGLLAGILGTVGNIFSAGAATQAEKEKQDTALYNAILADQGGSDTTKILIVSGIAVVFIVIGVVIIRSKK